MMLTPGKTLRGEGWAGALHSGMARPHSGAPAIQVGMQARRAIPI